MMRHWITRRYSLYLKIIISLWAIIVITVATAAQILDMCRVTMYWDRYGLYGIRTTIIHQCWRYGIGAVKCAGTDLVWG